MKNYFYSGELKKNTVKIRLREPKPTQPATPIKTSTAEAPVNSFFKTGSLRIALLVGANLALGYAIKLQGQHGMHPMFPTGFLIVAILIAILAMVIRKEPA